LEAETMAELAHSCEKQFLKINLLSMYLSIYVSIINLSSTYTDTYTYT
jgi:hypothetical protein